MNKIKHYGTVIQTVFSVEMSDNEQIPQEPIGVKLAAFTEEAFVAAFYQIKAERDRAIEQSDSETE